MGGEYFLAFFSTPPNLGGEMPKFYFALKNLPPTILTRCSSNMTYITAKLKCKKPYGYFSFVNFDRVCKKQTTLLFFISTKCQMHIATYLIFAFTSI